MEKQLQFNDDLGWHWHKSWNIPNILIRIDVKILSRLEMKKLMNPIKIQKI